MSDTTAQPALLLGSAVQAGFAAVGNVAARNEPAKGALADAPGAARQGFQAHLNALLRGPATADALSETAVEAPPIGLFVTAAPPVVSDGAALTGRADAKALDASGNNLPSAGKSLPLLSALSAQPAGVDPPTTALVSQDKAALSGATQLPAGSGANPGDDISLRAGANSRNGDGLVAGAGAKNEAQAIGIEQRYAADLLSVAARGSASQQSQSAIEMAIDGRPNAAVTESAIGAAAVPASADRVSDVMRRLNLQRPAASGVTGVSAAASVDADGEVSIQSVTELLTGRSDAPRTGGFADNTLAQFSLHGRPAEVIPSGASTSASATAETVLRDLQNMAPLRPQAGEAGNSWSAGLGQRLLMMAEGGVEVVRLRLHPAHLGPLEIHVNVEDERAQVWFGAQHGATRDALESALPRLREMFAAQGLELTHADVDDHPAHREGAPSERQPDVPRGMGSLIDRLETVSGSSDAALLWGSGAESRSLDIYV